MGVIDRMKIIKAPATSEEDASSRQVPGFDKKQTSIDVRVTHRPEDVDTDTKAEFMPKTGRINLFTDNDVSPTFSSFLGSNKEQLEKIGLTEPESFTAHEFAHVWQQAQQMAKGAVDLNDPTKVAMKSSGDPFSTLLNRHHTLSTLSVFHPDLFTKEHKKEMEELEDRWHKIKPKDSFDDREYLGYLNSDTERNARAIQTGYIIYHSYPKKFKRFSERHPDKTPDEIKQLVRSDLLGAAKTQEPTFNPLGRSPIANRYQDQYEKEYLKRMMIAIQHAEEAHLGKS